MSASASAAAAAPAAAGDDGEFDKAVAIATSAFDVAKANVNLGEQLRVAFVEGSAAQKMPAEDARALIARHVGSVADVLEAAAKQSNLLAKNVLAMRERIAALEDAVRAERKRARTAEHAYAAANMQLGVFNNNEAHRQHDVERQLERVREEAAAKYRRHKARCRARIAELEETINFVSLKPRGASRKRYARSQSPDDAAP